MARNFQYQNITKPAGDFPNPEEIFPDKWWEPLSEPVRFKIAPKLAVALIVASGAFWTPPPRATPLLSGFTQAASADVIYRTTLIYQSVAFPLPVEDTAGEDKWHQPWSEPLRFRRLAVAQQESATDVFQVETIFEDKWHQPWSEPVRKKPSLRTALQDTIADVPFNEDQGIEAKWHYPWSEPVRFRRFSVTQQQEVTDVIVTETIFEDKWHFPWSEPVRRRPSLRTALQDTVADIPFVEDAGIEAKWHYPWSEPVRFRRLSTAQQQAFIDPIAVPAGETVYEDKWHYPWTEPVRQKRGLVIRLQQTLAWSGFTPETINPDKWFTPLNEPPRPKVTIRLGSQQFVSIDTNPLVSFGWSQWWTEPVRQKPGLPARLQQFLSWPPLPDDSITGTMESRWHQPWSEPVRFRRFSASQQQDVTDVISFETIFEDKWHQPWSEPVRQKRGTPAYRQPFYTSIQNPIVSFSFYNWLTEPVRQKRGLRRDLQQSLALSIFIAPAVDVPEDRWHQAWSVPVRQKKGLRANLQQSVFWNTTTPAPSAATVMGHALSSPVIFKRRFFYQSLASPTRMLPFSAPVTVTLNATEINTDIAEFSVVVYNPSARIIVSIKEIPRGSGISLYSIEEPEEGGLGSIGES